MKYNILSWMVLFLLIGTLRSMAADENKPLNLRIIEISWEEDVIASTSGYVWVNGSTFEFTVKLEIWNRETNSYTFEHSDTCLFKAKISRISGNESWANSYPFACGKAITPVDYSSGLSYEQVDGGIAFKELNLNTLPFGTYRISTNLVNWNSKGVGYNLGLNVTVDETGLSFEYDTPPLDWGEVSSHDNLNYTIPFFISLLTLLVFSYKKKLHN